MSWLLKNLAWQGAHLVGTLMEKLGPADARTLGRLMGAKRSNPAAKGLQPFLSGFRDNYEGIVNTLATNGEAWLIEKLAPLDFKVAFDVGANVGNWTNTLAKHHPQATIHCFEIVPSTYAILKENTLPLGDRVVANSCGLSNSAGQIDIHVDPGSNVLSSMYDFSEGGSNATQLVRCNVQAGDEYMVVNRIDHIDFLKIDVEGAESLVLQGFENTLREKKVRLIQFEYNRGAIMSRFLLRDFYALFEKHGYCVGKLYPEGVRFLEYRLEHEDFMGPNYVACQSTDRGLINLISISLADL